MNNLFIVLTGVCGYFLGGGLYFLTYYFLQKFACTLQQDAVINFTVKTRPNNHRRLWQQLITGFLFALLAIRFPLSWLSVSYLILISGLIVLSAIDIACYLLPDCINFFLLWLGLFVSACGLSLPPSEAILGGIIGYLSLYSLGLVFKLLRGIEGIGRGDCKLLAVLGAWCGVKALPMILLAASLCGLWVGLWLKVYQRQRYSGALPFGPFLSLGGIVVMILQ